MQALSFQYFRHLFIEADHQGRIRRPFLFHQGTRDGPQGNNKRINPQIRQKCAPLDDRIFSFPQPGNQEAAHLIGPEVTELLPELTLAQMMELTPAEIARNVHAHPTLSEALMEAAHGASGHAIHI